MQLTEHFTMAELACRCCSQMRFTEEALDILEDIRTIYGEPMRISSGYRCPDHNAVVSSTRSRTGPHTVVADDNVAVDVLVSGPSAFRLVEVLMEGWKLGGLGIRQRGAHHQRYVHFDFVERPAGQLIWTYA